MSYHRALAPAAHTAREWLRAMADGRATEHRA